MDDTTSAPLSTRPAYLDYGKLPNFHYLSWNANLTNGHEPDDLIQPRVQIKLLFEESELVSGDSEAIRKFSDKYIVLEKLVAGYAEHLAQIKMRKEKKKEETEMERMEGLNREHNDIDWVRLYNSDKLSSLRVDGAILALFPSQVHLQREEIWKGLNDQSAHWHVVVRFNGVSTTSAATA